LQKSIATAKIKNIYFSQKREFGTGFDGGGGRPEIPGSRYK
jgi:hypothetical protein